MNVETLRRRIRTITKKYGIYIIFVGLIVVCTLLSENFLTSKNILSVARQLSITAILAFAEMMLIISGSIDLSLGSVLALAGMFAVNAYLATGSYLIAFLVAMLVGFICCSISGFFVSRVKLPAFVATLGMDFMARGAVYIYTGGQPVYNIGEFGKASSGYFLGLPIPVIIMLVIGVIAYIILSKTTFGRNLYAVGGNAEAAGASGIHVANTKLKAYMIAGILAGIAGALQMARLNSGLPDTGVGYQGDGIASAVIGGTSFTGGIGTAQGTLVGAFTIGILGNILNLTGVQSYVQQFVKGAIIVAAVAIDLTSKNRRIKKIAHTDA